MHAKSLRRTALVLTTLGLALCACAPTVQVHGYMPPAADVARITPGVDTIVTVEEALGDPSSSGLLRDSSWFYVESTFESFTYNPARVVDRSVLAISFDANGVVTDIERFGIEDGRIINVSNRTTKTGGRQLGVLEQIFGNLLTVDAEQFTR